MNQTDQREVGISAITAAANGSLTTQPSINEELRELYENPAATATTPIAAELAEARILADSLHSEEVVRFQGAGVPGCRRTRVPTYQSPSIARRLWGLTGLAHSQVY
ncbi:MAG: hypothetical protein DWQ31_18160 [Planctomycetota bacterium]|nr:MAG: hypothetical protein DWQ31_18160 [Planctomycetota bacterium]REJ93522.1 MAG: hypothetical protein DWQ35_10300 [Planctomycetota bacterium]REK24686.1 MAG: hypothetical protein DWQ42_13235 [Planctomycetota bacterium]REK40185.1 MAG: hypothetical protein DWQ46_17160 [Planctomycetota bacterium]